MEEFTQKWAIIIPLEHVEEGAEFHFSEFPLHITLAGVFAIPLEGSEIHHLLADLLAKEDRFEVVADVADQFGINKDVPVMKIRKSPELMHLYELIHSALLQQGAVFNTPQYEEQGYIPHSTNQKHAYLNEGERVRVNAISIVDLFPHGDGLQRQIFKTIKLEAL